MLVRMLESRRGTEDGFAVRWFECGRVYDLADCLARGFIAAGRAEALEKPVYPFKNIIKQHVE
jgi:hypothetical protein